MIRRQGAIFVPCGPNRPNRGDGVRGAHTGSLGCKAYQLRLVWFPTRRIEVRILHPVHPIIDAL